MKDCGGMHLDVGISISENINADIKGGKFQNVGTCYEIRKEKNICNTTLNSASTPIIPAKPIKSMKSNNSKIQENEVAQIIRNLLNLEINSKINKDSEQLKKIRRLKGLIGTDDFEKEYSKLFGNTRYA